MANAGHGQQNNYVFTHLGKDDRLLSNSVFCTVKDAKGFLWFATSNGLQCYDGKRMINFLHDEKDSSSLPANSVRGLLEDHRHRLWVFTTGGACIYDPMHYRFKRIPIDLTLKTDLPFRDFMQEENGTIWIAMFPGGLLRLDTVQMRFVPYTKFWPPFSYNIYHIARDKSSGFYWLGTDSGLAVYDPAKKIYYTRNYNPLGLHCFDDVNVSGLATAFYYDYNNILWLVFWPSAHSGPSAFRYDINKNTLSPTGRIEGTVYDFLTDHSGNTWVVGEELSVFDPAKKSFRYIPQKRNQLNGIDFDDMRDMYEDNEGNIWCSTNMGIYEFNPQRQQFSSIPLYGREGKQVVNPNINGFIETSDKHLIALGWGGSGFYFFDSLFNPLPPLYGYDERKSGDGLFTMTWCGLQDSHGLIWAGCQEGRLVIIDPQKKRTTFIKDTAFAGRTIRSIKEDPEGNIWLGTQHNIVVKWIHKTNRFVRIVPLAPVNYELHTILCFLPGKRHDMWAGTTGSGLVHFDLAGNILAQFRPQLASRQTEHFFAVNSISWTGDDKLLLGTESGLEIFNINAQKFEPLTETKGLLSDQVLAHCMDKNGNIWFTTSEGLSKYNPQSRRITNFGSRDGVTAAGFYPNSYGQFSGGLIAFGNPRGIVYFHPSDIRENAMVPDVQISSFALFGNMLPVDSLIQNGRTVSLQYNQNYISIRFSAMSFLLNDQLDYLYQLKGIDKDWVKAGAKTEANYTHLPPGEYEFMVKCISPAGVESAHVTSLFIHIHPPFWQRWWFFLLIALLVAGIIYFLDRMRINRILDMEKVRTRIARDLHDDMGSTLSTINILSAMANKKLRDDPLKTGEYIGKISDNSQRMMEAMDDIVWSINPMNDSMRKIIARMREFATGILEAKNIGLKFEVEEKVNEVKMDMEARRDFFLVFKEAINNVAKYSQCQTCSIHIRLQQQQLRMDIEDDGVGFKVSEADQGNGLSNMQKRAQALKGRIQVDSAPGGGTKVALHIPLT